MNRASDSSSEISASQLATQTVLGQSAVFIYNEITDNWDPKRLHCKDDTESTPEISSSFKVLSWNVDFTGRSRLERLSALLSHLQTTIIDPSSTYAQESNIPIDLPIILLQEIHCTCFPALLAHLMVRKHYALTSISSATWSHRFARYGLVTLIPLGLTQFVENVFRCPFTNSTMGRDALFVDFRMHPEKLIRIATTHLESLRGASDEKRPVQLGIITNFLRAPEVYGGLVGGDMNPIGPLDEGLTESLGLVDAWIATRQLVAPGTDSEGEEGHTWGYQPLNRFPPRRLDKFLLTGNLRASEMVRLGVGLKVKVSVTDMKTGNSTERVVWATDHYGLLVKINVV
ncbi:hypothetical protein BDN70DRAFT_871084 [Pholiota conissans]|uniref:Endonuclease/exonuclease/phosphatase domain-containing protein n=1 Tax=Pholiota conissans TaxID=109636 RepID=A0A9P6D787_9AGAR|nr:hypothetical protein BDN70DRAFT_871084 [Pholiota conissans]